MPRNANLGISKQLQAGASVNLQSYQKDMSNLRWPDIPTGQSLFDPLLFAHDQGPPRGSPMYSIQNLFNWLKSAGGVRVNKHFMMIVFDYLRTSVQIEVGYRTVVRWLHEHDSPFKVPQPWPDRQNDAQRTAWLAQLPTVERSRRGFMVHG